MELSSEIVDHNLPRILSRKPRHRLFRHLVALLAVGVMVYNVHPMPGVSYTYTRVVFFGLLVFLFYTNMYWLVPRYLFRKKYRAYRIGVLLCMLFGYLLVVATQTRLRVFVPVAGPDVPHYPIENPKIFPFLFLMTMLIGASSAIKLFQQWINDTRRINELEKITIQSELEQLKNQINPHFLFNMLNNANVLTQLDPEKASQVLMKLSGFLRYQLYDSARQMVLLTAEIHFLADFLNLEKVRRDHFEFSITEEGLLSGVQLAPLLFIIFVENAVKHNVDADKGSFVHLFFEMRDDTLYFSCVNSKPQMPAINNNSGGLGLANVKRRLELLYPGRHSIETKDETDTYTVTLTIQL